MQLLSKAFILAIATVTLGAFAIAAEEVQPETRSYAVEQVKNENYRVHTGSGPLALAKAYRKYGKSIPEPLVRVLRAKNLYRRDEGESTNITAAPELYDSEYLSFIIVGTPRQGLNVTIDTASSDFWLFSAALAEQEGGAPLRDRRGVYSPAKSVSARQLRGYSWNISYGDGSGASGNVYTDVVRLGNITANNQSIGAATHVSSMFIEDINNSGVIGLAFKDLNTVEPVQQGTFFDNIMANLSEPLFAADLKYNDTGSFDFGMTNSSKYTGNITYVPANTTLGFWGFSSSRYMVGNFTYGDNSVSGIADTGTTLLLLPGHVVQTYYRDVKGAQNSTEDAGGYVFPCNADLPSFTYTVSAAGSLNATEITIPGSYMNFAPAEMGMGSCYGALQSSDGFGVNIYGDVALKAAYVVFKGGDTPELGVASKNLG